MYIMLHKDVNIHVLMHLRSTRIALILDAYTQLEVFSEDVPHSILWCNYGTK